MKQGDGQADQEGSWWNYIVYDNSISKAAWWVGGVIKSVLVFFKNVLFSGEDTSGMISGEEFKRVFYAKLEESEIHEEMKVEIFDRTFQELCEEARVMKRPILVMTIREPNE